MVNNRQNRVTQMLKPARGQALVEYALILVLLAMALSFAVAATGPAIGNVFCNVVDNLAGEASADICGRGAGPLDVAGGSPNLFWATVTWVAQHPQKETPFPTPIRQPPTSGASVYNSPTPSLTPSRTPTPTITPTPSRTPTVTPGPSATPGDIGFTVPHVDQINNPAWWRLGSGLWLGSSGEQWSATWYDDVTLPAAAFNNWANLNLTVAPIPAVTRNTLIYPTSDLNFTWGGAFPVGSGYPAGSGITDYQLWSGTLTRTASIASDTTVEITLKGTNYLRLSIDGVPVDYSNGTTKTITRTLTAGSHTFDLLFAKNWNTSDLVFSVRRLTVNPNDSAASNCPWGQVSSGTTGADSNANSALFQFENKAGGTWTSGATCNLEMRGYVDINAVTNPVLSFWDVWDFVGATATAKLQVAPYIVDVNGFFDRANATWADVNLHSGGSSNYNWTRYEVPIGTYGGATGKVTFRFVLTGDGASNFRWHIDDLQILSQSLAPGSFTVGNSWNLNARSQMSDFIFNADTNKTLEDNPSLPNTVGPWRWDLTSTNTRGTGTAWDDSPGYTSPRHSLGDNTNTREYYLELKKSIDLSIAPAQDLDLDTGNPLLSFWMAYDVPIGSRLQVEYTRDARDTTPDTWTAVPNGGLLLGYALQLGIPAPNEQVARTNLVMQYIAVDLTQIPNWNTSSFRLRFARSIQNNTTPTGQGWYIDDIAIERQNASPYLAYPFYDDAETSSNLTAYWTNVGGSWGRSTEIPVQSFAATSSALTPGAKGTGTSYSDSPNASYASLVTRSLELRYPLDLLHDSPSNTTDAPGRAAASEPLLNFWHRRQVGPAVRLSVELWTPTTALWKEVWYYNSATQATSYREQDAWERVEINLRRALEAASGSTWAAIVSSASKFDDDVKIRFTFVTDTTGSMDGVYVDEISINNSNYPTFKVWPTSLSVSGVLGDGTFAENVEGMDATGSLPSPWYNRWFTGGLWSASDGGGSTRNGSLVFEVAPGATEYMHNSLQYLEAASIIDMTGTPTTPSTEAAFLRFWTRYDLASGHYLRVQISQENAAEASSLTNQFYGKIGGWGAWTDVTYSVDSSTYAVDAANNRRVDTWVRAQANLNTYRGSRIRLRFVVDIPDASSDRDVYIDAISVSHAPRNLGTPFVDSASSTVNWVTEGSWGLTNQYFTGTGEATLGTGQWTGWFYDCEGTAATHGQNCAGGNTPQLAAFENLLYTQYRNPPTTPTCASGSPLFATSGPVGPQCITDTTVDLFMGGGRPMTSMSATFDDTWVGRWTRTVTLIPGTYRVTTVSDDGVRLWIDNVAGTSITPYSGSISCALACGRPIDDWSFHSNSVANATFTVTASITRTLSLEFFEGGGDANVWLGISRQNSSFSDSPNTLSGTTWTQVNSTLRGNSSLITDGYFNFSAASTPLLAYEALYNLGSQTSLVVETSTNGGFTWTSVDTIGTGSVRAFTSGWESRPSSVTSFRTATANQANVMLRFRLSAMSATTTGQVSDGVWITDIRVTGN